MRVRRSARIVTFQTLFEFDVAGHDPNAAFLERIEQSPLPDIGVEFARSLLHGIIEHRAELDRIIQHIAPEWPVDQLAPVDRSILRMAVYEITLSLSTPPKVAINEAVELAKAFGSESSQRFVNGALGALLKEPLLSGA